MGVCISGIMFGFALLIFYISANSYIVDSYSNYAASAIRQNLGSAGNWCNSPVIRGLDVQ